MVPASSAGSTSGEAGAGAARAASATTSAPSINQAAARSTPPSSGARVSVRWAASTETGATVACCARAWINRNTGRTP
jgi:hypothetical protein